MGPDYYWVVIFSFGGLAIGLLTSFVGLNKAREFTSWMVVYGFMITAATLLDLETPFWTVFAASIFAALQASIVQIILLRHYRAHNPWHAALLDRPTHRIALSWLGYAIFSGTLFGIFAATLAWALSLL